MDQIFTAKKEIEPNSAALKNEFRERLIGPTLFNAVHNISAYRNIKLNKEPGEIRLNDLNLWPILTKDKVMSSIEMYCNTELDTALVQHTTGTTGRKLYLKRSSAEIEFINSFFNDAETVAPGSAPTCLTLISEYNGQPLPVPYPGKILELNLQEPSIEISQFADKLWEHLGCEHDDLCIIGLESQLRILTVLLIEQSYDFSRSPVTQLISTGDLLTSRLKKWYEVTWNVSVYNRYGLTEIFGGASQCPSCGSFHFDAHIVPEVVNPITHEPIESGCGVLLLSPLYPFVQKQPLIRYWTGDLVEISDHSCPIDDFGLFFHGRLSRCIIDENNSTSAPLLSAAIIYDLLDDYPEVASSKMFSNIPGLHDYSALGHLKFEFDRTRDCLRIKVETRFSPELYPTRSTQLKYELKQRILDASANLRSKVQSGSINLDLILCGPETLSSFMPDEAE